MIIGICGLIGSGKDTIADYLQNIHQFRRESFAHTLKDAVAAVFGWDRELLEGRTRESREWREQVDPWWTARLNIPVTPRLVLQVWGTEVARKSYHDDIWIASLENKLRKTHDDIVISDCRFPNEILAIKRVGGVVIRVTRGPDPEWYDLARTVNQGPTRNTTWRLSKTQLDSYGVHASETAWIGTEFDAIIDNNQDGMDSLFRQVKHLVVNLQAAKEDLPV
jgi:hypothetical protein